MVRFVWSVLSTAPPENSEPYRTFRRLIDVLNCLFIRYARLFKVYTHLFLYENLCFLLLDVRSVHFDIVFGCLSQPFTVGGKKGNRTEPNQRIIPDGAYENFRLLRYRVLPPSPNRTQRMRYLLVILSLFLFSLLN